MSAPAELVASLLYFGCKTGETGHYLWHRPWRAVAPWDAPFQIDGVFAPRDAGGGRAKLGLVTDSKGVAWTVVAWWDESQDRRPGSNSAFLAPGGDWCFADMIAAAREKFPSVMQRQAAPVELLKP